MMGDDTMTAIRVREGLQLVQRDGELYEMRIDEDGLRHYRVWRPALRHMSLFDYAVAAGACALVLILAGVAYYGLFHLVMLLMR